MMAPDSQSWSPVLGSSMAGVLDKIANKLKFIDLYELGRGDVMRCFVPTVGVDFCVRFLFHGFKVQEFTFVGETEFFQYDGHLRCKAIFNR